MSEDQKLDETMSIADGFVEMVTRWLEEGASGGTLAAGIAPGLTIVGRQGAGGKGLIDTIKGLLQTPSQ